MVHDFAHVCAQRPLQQSGAVRSQSEETLHVFAQGAYWLLRQRPGVLKLGSTVSTDVQQISPWLVAQSVLAVHAFGHLLAGRQMAWL